MLSSYFESPIVSEASVGSALFESFQVLSQFGLQVVGHQLGVGAVLEVVSSVQKPQWDAVTLRIGDDVLNCLAVFFSQLPGSLNLIFRE